VLVVVASFVLPVVVSFAWPEAGGAPVWRVRSRLALAVGMMARPSAQQMKRSNGASRLARPLRVWRVLAS
jgi:hypothetical protein